MSRWFESSPPNQIIFRRSETIYSDLFSYAPPWCQPKKQAYARMRINVRNVLGEVEGTNNTIKSLRRAGYGYPDDEYFFLKIFDASRRYSPVRETAAE